MNQEQQDRLKQMAETITQVPGFEVSVPGVVHLTAGVPEMITVHLDVESELLPVYLLMRRLRLPHGIT